MEKVDLVRELLRQVYDPELGVNIVDLGLVYNIRADEKQVDVEMTLTTPGCPMHDTIRGGAERMLKEHLGDCEVRVAVIWNPPWTPDKMSDDAKAMLGFC